MPSGAAAEEAASVGLAGIFSVVSRLGTGRCASTFTQFGPLKCAKVLKWPQDAHNLAAARMMTHQLQVALAAKPLAVVPDRSDQTGLIPIPREIFAMVTELQNTPSAHLVNWQDLERFDVMGPSVQFLTAGTGAPDSPCIMRGTVLPDTIIPLHSHGDPETFIQISGEFEGLSESAEGFAWTPIRPGDVFHVPANAKHAFRNRCTEPAVSVIVTTCRLGSFLRSVGIADAAAQAPSPERVQHFLTTAEAFGYWNGSPEENARVGLHLPPMQ